MNSLTMFYHLRENRIENHGSHYDEEDKPERHPFLTVKLTGKGCPELSSFDSLYNVTLAEMKRVFLEARGVLYFKERTRILLPLKGLGRTGPSLTLVEHLCYP
jgi:hypothetical protein